MSNLARNFELRWGLKREGIRGLKKRGLGGRKAIREGLVGEKSGSFAIVGSWRVSKGVEEYEEKTNEGMEGQNKGEGDKGVSERGLVAIKVVEGGEGTNEDLKIRVGDEENEKEVRGVLDNEIVRETMRSKVEREETLTMLTLESETNVIDKMQEQRNTWKMRARKFCKT